MSEPRARVQAVLNAARRIANPDDPLGREARERLPAASGLSPAGVELALSAHLETDASDGELTALVQSQTPAPHCHLLLAANVCTAALRAYACAAAVSERLSVRASSRDPVVAELLARALDGGPLSVALVDELAPRAGDQVHAYGSDETLATVAKTLPRGSQLLAHGTGIGVAVIEADAELGEAAERLADDVVPFDGRGCLSPRFALVDATKPERAASFARALDRALRQRGAVTPRGPLDEEAQAAISRYRRLIDTIGVFMEGPDHAVALDPAPTALSLPPAARVVLVVGCNSEQLATLTKPWLQYVTAIGRAGSGSFGATLRRQVPTARTSPLGRMQKPPLDGPVDRRQLEK